jgi:hypothetical protein
MWPRGRTAGLPGGVRFAREHGLTPDVRAGSVRGG